MKSISPLRYPGGKAKFYDNIIKILLTILFSSFLDNFDIL